VNAKECYEAGRLNDALAASLQEVKSAPADTGRRGFLCTLACFAGDLDRADKQLDLLGDQDPKAAMGVALFRQLIRAEQARQQFYTEGRLPEFLTEATPVLKMHLEASIHLRDGKPGEAAKLLAAAEEQRPKVSGTCDGQAFADLRDLDDLVAPVFEVLTSTGKYYWVPIDHVELVEFHAPERPRDLIWRPAHMIVRGGPDGEVYLPALYAGTHAAAEDSLRLGRSTDWTGGSGQPVRGLGLRTYLVGEAAMTIMEMKELTFGEGS
jgi:type VI secretion system protein ImpE